MTQQTDRIRSMIGTAIALDQEWQNSSAGRDNLAIYLPWMSFSWPDFIALVTEALPETAGDRFLDIGCGIGTKMMLAEEIFGLNVRGVERVPEYVKVARERGMAVTEADALTWNGYGDADLVFFNRPFSDQVLQAQLEERVWAEVKHGAVVIAVNTIAPPPASWYPVLDDREVRRWISQRP